MQDKEDFQPSPRALILTLLLGFVLCTVCYIMVDRPVAFFVHDHAWNHVPFFLWLTLPPPIVQAWTPAVLTVCVIGRIWKPFPQWELALVTACISLLLADQFRESLAFVCGRAWPETWVNNNPSLIGNGTFGFYPFRSSTEYSCFPSGHAARIGAAAAVVWIVYPKWRWACLFVMTATAGGLLGMNYHFLSDIIAGGFIGGIIGTYTTYSFGLVIPRAEDQQNPKR